MALLEQEEDMSYYNPRIYNYSNLKPEDKRFIYAMSLMVEGLELHECDYLIEDECSTLERIECEIAQEVLKEAEEYLKADMREFIVAIIDGYEEDVPEVDTDDHFYGLSEDE